MPKICNADDCNYNVFGGGYCPRHQYLRTDKKPKPLQQRTAIKKISDKGKLDRERKAEISRKDKEFFAEIWDEREHICFETGKYLGNEPLTLFFHHVLPKKDGAGGYPQFRYEKWNIVLLSWDAHSKAEVNIDFAPKVKAYRDELLKTKAIENE